MTPTPGQISGMGGAVLLHNAQCQLCDNTGPEEQMVFIKINGQIAAILCQTCYVKGQLWAAQQAYLASRFRLTHQLPEALVGRHQYQHSDVVTIVKDVAVSITPR